MGQNLIQNKKKAGKILYRFDWAIPKKMTEKKIPIFKINRLLFELTGKNFNRNLKKQPKTKN